MKRIVRLIVLLVSALMLSGCVFGNADIRSAEKEVNEYNNIVKSTVEAYTGVTEFIKNNEEKLLDVVLKDDTWSLAPEITSLTEEEKECFKVNAVVYNYTFTALGATSIRQVLVINGRGKQMVVTVIWEKDKILSLKRRVTNL